MIVQKIRIHHTAVKKCSSSSPKNIAIQATETMNKLRIADITIPSLTAFLAIIVMWKYDLTEKKAREIKSKLVARRGEL